MAMPDGTDLAGDLEPDPAAEAPATVIAHGDRLAAQRMAAKLRPRAILPRLVSSTAARSAEARGRRVAAHCRAARELRAAA
jgi:hypothetical protein